MSLMTHEERIAYQQIKSKLEERDAYWERKVKAAELRADAVIEKIASIKRQSDPVSDCDTGYTNFKALLPETDFSSPTTHCNINLPPAAPRPVVAKPMQATKLDVDLLEIVGKLAWPTAKFLAQLWLERRMI